MARSCLINPYLLAALVLVCSLGSGARAGQELLKIDINDSRNITYTGWTGWELPDNDELIENTFDNGIRIAFSSPRNTPSTPIEVGVRGNSYWGSFSGDSVEVIDPPTGWGDLDCVISFLSPGNYTFITYHNEWIAGSNMDVNSLVGPDANDTIQVYHDIPQCHHIPDNEYVIANGAVAIDFNIPQPDTDFRASYITSFNYPVDQNDRNVAICGFRLIANNIYAAYSASPLPESRIRANTTYNLCWNTPDPYDPGTQRYDLYFTTNPGDLTDTGTGQPLFPASKRLVTYQVQSGRMCIPCPALQTYKDYYWRVDSYGMQGGSEVRTVGMRWHFDTDNQPPTLDLGENQVSVQGRWVTLTAVSTDLDELPVGRTITYNWIDRTDVNDPNYTDAYPVEYPSPFPTTTPSVSFVLDPNDAHVGTGRTYRYQCTVSDSANTYSREVYVTVYPDTMTYCEVNKKLANYQTAIRSPGDFNDDCLTDFKDISTLALQWLDCTAVDNLCL
jgi:hypothetical protein